MDTLLRYKYGQVYIIKGEIRIKDAGRLFLFFFQYNFVYYVVLYSSRLLGHTYMVSEGLKSEWKKETQIQHQCEKGQMGNDTLDFPKFHKHLKLGLDFIDS